MDSALSDSTPKLDTSSTSVVPPSGSGSVGTSNASYYQPAGSTAVPEPSAVSPVSAPSSATSTSVSPASSAGSGVLPAAANPTLGSTLQSSSPVVEPVVSLESPTRQNLPTMGTTAPTLPPNTVVMPPTVSNEATANQVQERMQAANAAAAGSGGTKRSLLLPILGAIVVLAIAAAGAFWWWQSQNSDATPVGLDTTLTQENTDTSPAGAVVTEGVVPRSDSVNNDFADSEITDETPNTGEVYGLICKYENTHPAGVVAFYEPETKTIHRLQILQEKNVYSMKVPAGQYLAFFEPTNEELPIFAFTQYVNCGLTPDSCTDHSMALFTVEADQEYGQVDLCDPQYIQDGLPSELQYENS